MHWWLPIEASSYASDIDGIFYAILVITGVIFVVVEAALVYFLVKYRGREGRKAEYIHGSNRAEVIWTLIPALIVVGLAFVSKGVWDEVKGRDATPPGAIPMAVEAKQFEWHVTYPGPDGQLGTDDDFTRRNLLHVPVGKPVSITLTSQDVIHSFFVPVFRIKQDAVPGMHTHVWFTATRAGDYELACAELCGLGHFRMRGQVVAEPLDAFEGWMQQQSTEASGTATASDAGSGTAKSGK